MPFFEYRCQNCSKKYTLLYGVSLEKPSLACPYCGSTQATKLISRFRRLRSEEESIEKLADPSAIGDLRDPQALRSWAKRLGKEMGEDLGDEFDEMLEQEMEKESKGEEEEKEEEESSENGEEEAI